MTLGGSACWGFPESARAVTPPGAADLPLLPTIPHLDALVLPTPAHSCSSSKKKLPGIAPARRRLTLPGGSLRIEAEFAAWRGSSVGRAHGPHPRGRGFESHPLHQHRHRAPPGIGGACAFTTTVSGCDQTSRPFLD